MTTLRPLGPSVTFTASARMLTPRSMRSRASVLNLTSLAAIVVRSLDCSGMSWDQEAASGRANDSHDVRLLHDQVFVAVVLDLGTRDRKRTRLNYSRL